MAEVELPRKAVLQMFFVQIDVKENGVLMQQEVWGGAVDFCLFELNKKGNKV